MRAFCSDPGWNVLRLRERSSAFPLHDCVLDRRRISPWAEESANGNAVPASDIQRPQAADLNSCGVVLDKNRVGSALEHDRAAEPHAMVLVEVWRIPAQHRDRAFAVRLSAGSQQLDEFCRGNKNLVSDCLAPLVE